MVDVIGFARWCVKSALPGYTEQLSGNTHLTISQAVESCANDLALIGNCLPATPICSGYGPLYEDDSTLSAYLKPRFTPLEISFPIRPV